MVSSMIALIIAGGAFTAIQASGRASNEQQNRVRANAIAQSDQARMRAFAIDDLYRLNQTRTVVQDGTQFTVTSTGRYVNDQNGTSSCSDSDVSADYVEIKSSVNWSTNKGRPPVTVASVVTPSAGAREGYGSLVISVVGGASQPISGVGLVGNGPEYFSGTTNSSGCALFQDLKAGNYTLTPNAPGKVDRDGKTAAPQTVSVVGGATNSVVLQLDTAASFNLTFKTRDYNNTVVNSTAGAVLAVHSGMSAARTFGNVASPQSSQTLGSLFPFSSPYSFYAGSCTGNLPGQSAGIASATLAPGGSGSASVQLPSILVTVIDGNNAVSGGQVVFYSQECSSGGQPVARRKTTLSTGRVADPGVPWGTYTICANDNQGYQYASGTISAKSYTSSTAVTIDLKKAPKGVCP